MSYQVPRGTQDILPKDISKWHRLEELIRQFCYVYDYEEIRTPIFEHTNVFKRGNDSSDMVNKEMYTFCLENSSTSPDPAPGRDSRSRACLCGAQAVWTARPSSEDVLCRPAMPS